MSSEEIRGRTTSSVAMMTGIVLTVGTRISMIVGTRIFSSFSVAAKMGQPGR